MKGEESCQRASAFHDSLVSFYLFIFSYSVDLLHQFSGFRFPLFHTTLCNSREILWISFSKRDINDGFKLATKS